MVRQLKHLCTTQEGNLHAILWLDLKQNVKILFFMFLVLYIL